MSLGSVNKMIEHIDENQIKQYTRNLICAVEHCHKIANIIHKDINDITYKGGDIYGY